VNAVEVRATRARIPDRAALRGRQVVKKGDLLFRIDPSTYQVGAREARRAILPRARAAERARREFARAEQLVKDDVASIRCSTRGARRARRRRGGDRERRPRACNAPSSNLSYTVVRAPLAGRIGRALVDVGNLVGESGQDTVLAQIVQVDPIHVDFAPTERDRLGVLRDIASGPLPAQNEGLPV
jgi:multidrug efflux pump subunit AcrA (membrane-fusion protein)